MNSPNPNIFTKVNDLNERETIFNDLNRIKSEILAKPLGKLKKPFLLKVKSYDGQQLECEIKDKSLLPLIESEEELIFHLPLRDEIYLCATKFKCKRGMVYISSNTELYYLQRRENFRLRLPAGLKSQLQFQTTNGHPCTGKLQIEDLSAGGCRLKLNPKVLSLKLKDKFSGILDLPGYEEIQIEGEVLRMDESSYGVQFINQTGPAEHRIGVLVIELYRQLFLKNT
jgi:hypothetical protein